MSWIANVWEVVSPYLLEIARWLVNTGVGASIGLLIVKSWQKKHSDSAIAETITSNVTDKILNNIATTDIKVSLESINEKQITSLKNDLLKQFASAFEDIKMQNEALSAMAKIMVRFKAATAEERQNLIEKINAIENKEKTELTTNTAVNNTVVVNIEPIVKAEETTSENLF